MRNLLISLVFIASHTLHADVISTEERFQDIFVTAGYATAFGAALGAASLSFVDKPQDNLQHIAIGASIGFITGSILGSYIVFNPSMASNNKEHDLLAGIANTPVSIRPTYSTEKQKINGLGAAFNLLNF